MPLAILGLGDPFDLLGLRQRQPVSRSRNMDLPAAIKWDEILGPVELLG